MNLNVHGCESIDLVAGLYSEQFSDVLAIDQLRLSSILTTVQAIGQQDIEARIKAHEESVQKQKSYSVQDGIAHVQLKGVISKNGSSLSGAGSTTAARFALRSAAADKTVKGIIFHVESPGGAWAGTSELNNVVAQIAKSGKPIWVAGDDLVASGGYLAAVSANQIWLNKPGRIGSIGAYSVVVDSSGAAEKEGYRVHLVKFGQNKGAGVQGVPVDDAALAVFQKQINDVGQQFVEQVAVGRNISIDQALTWATGETYTAVEAKRMGMIDQIGTPEEATAALLAQIKGTKSFSGFSGVKAMTLKEIKANCAGIKADEPADQAFLVKLGEKDDLTPDQVKDAWAKELADRVAAAKAETAKVSDQLAKQKAKDADDDADQKIKDELNPGGNKAPKDGFKAKGTGDDMDQIEGVDAHPFCQAVRERAAQIGGDEQQALIQVATERPNLHADYVLKSSGTKAKAIRNKPE